MPAVSVIVTAPGPVAVVGKKVEHQIEQLHRLADFGFWHWFDPSQSRVTHEVYHRPQRAASDGVGVTAFARAQAVTPLRH